MIVVVSAPYDCWSTAFLNSSAPGRNDLIWHREAERVSLLCLGLQWSNTVIQPGLPPPPLCPDQACLPWAAACRSQRTGILWSLALLGDHGDQRAGCDGYDGCGEKCVWQKGSQVTERLGNRASNLKVAGLIPGPSESKYISDKRRVRYFSVPLFQSRQWDQTKWDQLSWDLKWGQKTICYHHT